MTDQAKILFAALHTAADKFDYFVCAISAAIFAYIYPNTQPHHIASFRDGVGAFGLLCIGLSFICGLNRIRYSLGMLRLNTDAVQIADKAKTVSDSSPSLERINEEVFELWATDEEREFRETITKLGHDYTRKYKSAWSAKTIAKRWSTGRDLLLWIGVSLLAFDRFILNLF